MSTFLLSYFPTFSRFYLESNTFFRTFAVWNIVEPKIIRRGHKKINIYATTEKYSQEVY